MATHKLFKGGVVPAGTVYNGVGIPNEIPNDWSGYTMAAHKSPAMFALSWSLAPAERAVGPNAQKCGHHDQMEYFNQVGPLAVGDVIQAILIPPHVKIDSMYVASEQVVNGLTFDVNLVTLTNPPTSVPLDPVDLSLAPFHNLDSQIQAAAAAGLLVPDEGMMIELTVTAVPATLKMSCVRLGISVAAVDYNRGDMILTSCSNCN